MKVSPENQSEPSWWDRNSKFVFTAVAAVFLGVGLACAIILPITLPTGTYDTTIKKFM